ncbi:MAG: hypothetical protein Q8N91_06465 [Candidatus Omnitrophota bacterium]|nr:hypothetical protein [Candidatus Omnitrophota bacterium]
MAGLKTGIGIHPADVELADFLTNSLSAKEAEGLTKHLASCNKCLEKTVSAYESVKLFQKGKSLAKKGKVNFMKKINIYLALAIISFVLSFMIPRHFLQLLVATLVLGIKWIADSKTTKMLIMIYEAWQRGGEKEASRILETLDSERTSRF